MTNLYFQARKGGIFAWDLMVAWVCQDKVEERSLLQKILKSMKTHCMIYLGNKGNYADRERYTWRKVPEDDLGKILETSMWKGL